jgi:UDP-glucose 4-epimerase
MGAGRVLTFCLLIGRAVTIMAAANVTRGVTSLKILVTGGAGFIGSHISDAFLAAGHEVAVVDNLASGREGNLPKGAAVHRVDVRSEDLKKLCLAWRPEVICHQAAQVDVRRSVSDPLFDAGVNVLGAINVAQSALECGARKVIFASSGGAIYGEQERFPAPEGHPTDPVSPYGVSKLAGEKYLGYYHLVHGLPYVALRYANVYGPRQDPFGEAGVVAIFTSKMLAGGEPVINGDGLQTRDYVFVDDVARANVLALEPTAEGPYNIGTGVETDVVTLFSRLKALTGAACQEVHGPAKAGEQRRSVLDPSKAREGLGWRAKVPIEEGLAATVEYFRRESR